MRTNRQRGFTLLEVLLVVLLMGIAATAVTLSIGNNGPQQQLDKSANQFMTAVRVVLDEAILNGQFVGVVIEPDSYEFVLFKEDKWQALAQDRLLAKRELEYPTRLDVIVEGMPLIQDDEQDESWFDDPFEEADVGFTQDKKLPEPQILLFPSGEVTAFELIFAVRDDKGQPLEAKVFADSLGRLSREPFDEI
ncbi:type II secretion system minor pseudopilin GspH [Shewanella sp. NIFS-20-20]|uniref:type II secretion system minor pseudopilin GspH n=1 Tax=Shewanella sp. NIFS-20-20 TaxID=2853806 RepID=UPI001C48FF50|nr:type II secretion system minor pseudopilin GspH [Shewanella sp. NIFS-20-20]MBV7316696.1 type II secretion system minor pseudopilin GspH [Shewanella sp. NIFS-20-20]